MAAYYRAFCKNCSTVASLLTSLLSPSVSFVWSTECEHDFKSVKVLFCRTPVLSACNFNRPFKLEMDAIAYGAGAVLLYEDTKNAVDHLVCYFSRKFNKHQVN